MRYEVDACVADVMHAAGVDADDAQDILHNMLEKRDEIAAELDLDFANIRLEQIAQGFFEGMQKDAIQQRRNALKNVVLAERVGKKLDVLNRNGMKSPAHALEALLLGTHKGVNGARESVYAAAQRMEHNWMGKIWARIAEEKPHIAKLIQRDKGFPELVTREMFYIDEGRNVTGNKDARWLAQLLSDVSDVSRHRLVNAGADVKRLRNWVPQRHDVTRIMRAGREKWKRFVLENDLLDMRRTFGDLPRNKVAGALDQIYDTIVRGTGGDTVADWGSLEFRAPKDMAAALEKKHRVLFFNDAQAWGKYAGEFGSGSLFDSVFGHLRQNAQDAALLENLGSSPKHLLEKVLETERQKIWNRTDLTDEQKSALAKTLPHDLSRPNDKISRAWAIASGEADRAVPNFAKIGKLQISYSGACSAIRNWVSMGKLGMAVVSAMTDIATASARIRWHGVNPLEGYATMVHGLMKGKQPEEMQAIAHLLGVGFDGLLGDVHARFMAEDHVAGRASAWAQKFFKLSGLNWWTDRMRQSFALMSSANLAMNTAKNFDQLDDFLKHTLSLHGIDERTWSAIQKMETRAADGKHYIVPEAALMLPDEAIDAYIAPKLAEYRAYLHDRHLKQQGRGAQVPTDDAAYQMHVHMNLERRTKDLRLRARQELEDKLAGFFLDETNYGVIVPDGQTRKWQTAGLQPGTLWGEVCRFMMQFKSFPIAFTQRVIGAHMQGGPGGRPDFGGLAQVIAGTTLLGGMAMTVKDALKGREPRDFTKPETWLAAAIQGGGAGIYGDFLLGKFDRFGDSPMKTIEGPFLGTADDLAKMLLNTAHGAPPSKAQFMYWAVNNTPFVNLWYTRLPLDYLVLYNLQEWASPGYLQRMQRRMKEEYNQEMIAPPTQYIQRGGGFK